MEDPRWRPSFPLFAICLKSRLLGFGRDGATSIVRRHIALQVAGGSCAASWPDCPDMSEKRLLLIYSRLFLKAYIDSFGTTGWHVRLHPSKPPCNAREVRPRADSLVSLPQQGLVVSASLMRACQGRRRVAPWWAEELSVLTMVAGCGVWEYGGVALLRAHVRPLWLQPWQGEGGNGGKLGVAGCRGA